MVLRIFPACWRFGTKKQNKKTKFTCMKKIQTPLCCHHYVSLPWSCSVHVTCLPCLSIKCWVVKVPITIAGTNTVPADELIAVWFWKQGFAFRALKEAVYIRGIVKSTHGFFNVISLFKNKDIEQDALWFCSPVKMLGCIGKNEGIGPCSQSCTISTSKVAG